MACLRAIKHEARVLYMHELACTQSARHKHPEMAMTRAEALRVASAAEVPLRRPQQLVAVWLAALTWPADMRWRACGPAAPSDAMFALLSSLSAHVTALRVAADSRAAGAPSATFTQQCCPAKRRWSPHRLSRHGLSGNIRHCMHKQS